MASLVLAAALRQQDRYRNWNLRLHV